MVEVIVKEIGKQVKELNPYFDTFAVNAIQMPDGKVVVNFYGDEPVYEGIEDYKGVAFYIRIEPKATIQKATQQLTSCTPSYNARQRCHLVAFAFSSPKEIDSDKWVDKLARCLLEVNLKKIPSKPSIQIQEKNANHIDNFNEETKKRFNVQEKFNCVKVSFDLFYDVALEDCNFCDIYKDPC